MRTITLTDEQTFVLIRALRVMQERQEAVCDYFEKQMAVYEEATGTETDQLLALAADCEDYSTLSEGFVDWLSAHELDGVSNGLTCDFVHIIQKLEEAPRWDYVDKEPDTFAQRMKVMTYRQMQAALRARSANG